MFYCSSCKHWYDQVCFHTFTFSFFLSMKSANIICQYCQNEIYRELGNYISQNIKITTLPQICRQWNESLASNCVPDMLDFVEEINQPSTENCSIRASKRGFENTASNCWISTIMQLLLSSPLKQTISKANSPLGKVLKKLCLQKQMTQWQFQNWQ